MQDKHLQHIRTLAGNGRIDVRHRQSDLRASYETDPAKAWVTDRARTVDAEIGAAHPIHGQVIYGTAIPADQPVSVHCAVGGESDFPCPGEMLAAALASCLDTATRMIANLMGITLERLQVSVALGADVRGTLMMGKNVPVGFEKAVVTFELKAAGDVSQARLDALANAAERSCVLLQTLLDPPEIEIERNLRFEE